MTLEVCYIVDASIIKSEVVNRRQARAEAHIRSRRIERLIDRKTGLAAQEGTSRIDISQRGIV